MDNKIKINPATFYFEVGLYKKIYPKESGYDNTTSLLSSLYSNDILGYNFNLSSETTFRTIDRPPTMFGNLYLNGIHRIDVICKRDENYKLVFYVEKTDDFIQKVGQLPSYADLQKIDKDFEKELSSDDKNNYAKAIGLFSYNVNIGAYSYLRRIFENIIYNCYITNKNEIKNLLEEDFRRLNMSEKIFTLKDFLPQSITKFKIMYGIVSKGIHELSEDECSKYFIPLKTVIDLAIKENIKIKQEISDKKELENELQKIALELSNN
jgi:hypothetical protein